MKLVCWRQRDLVKPSVKSFAGVCGLCGEPIWIAYSSPTGADEALCMQCLVEVIEPGDEVCEPTKAQWDDIRKTRS
jgi:hypothetical protein